MASKSTLWSPEKFTLNYDFLQSLLGIDGSTNDTKCLNLIILAVKREINIGRKCCQLPCVNDINSILKTIRDNKYKIAYERNNLGTHLAKWDSFPFVGMGP